MDNASVYIVDGDAELRVPLCPARVDALSAIVSWLREVEKAFDTE
jgi:hypothetical protein